MNVSGGGTNTVEIPELLRRLGEDALLREAEAAGLSPKGRRIRCPFEGCTHKGKDRERDAQVYAGGHPRIFCYACEGRGDLVDLVQLTRGLSKAEAIAHLTGQPAPPPARAPLQLVQPPVQDEPDRLSPNEVKRLWEAMAREDAAGQGYLEGRSLGDAVARGLVRFATERHADASVKSQGKRGYRAAVLLSDVVGNPRGVQLRLVREPRAKEPKIVSIKGSVTSRAFFGDPGAIEAAPIVAVAEGLADTLALASWVGSSNVAVVGAAGKQFLPKLAEELEAANIPLEGKLFALFPQNDRPKNHSRREFVRLSQLLAKRGAHVVLVQTDAEFKDLAEWLHARPDIEWPPPELAKAFAPEPTDTTPAENKLELAEGCAVAIPAQVRAEYYAQDFTTLCALLDDPVHREAVMGRGEISFCEMTSMVRMNGRTLTEIDLAAIRLGLESQGRSTDGKPLKFGIEDIAMALQLIARRRTVHPVRDWLKSLKWDGVRRIDTELADALGHSESSLASVLLRRWMISAVARAMKPGCKVDTALVLVGPQGAGKSSFFAALGGEWFTDSPVRVDDKDGKMVMRRTWIVEWAELDSMRRARDQEAIKAFLSSRVDHFRKPYGRDVQEVPRACVIVGTTNHREFLHDPTGNRRFWPIEVSRIEVPWVRLNREQLFAEARELYESGERWWLDAEEEAELVDQSREHVVHDAWLDPLADWLRSQRALSEVTTGHALANAIGKPAGQWTRADENRVGILLRELGWDRTRRRVEGRIRWVYVRGGLEQ
jgi:hypothetical protein